MLILQTVCMPLWTEVCIHCTRMFALRIQDNRCTAVPPFFKPLSDFLTFTVHEARAYGSERPKWTVLAHNTVALKSLNPGLVLPDHRHNPWGMTGPISFSTSRSPRIKFRHLSPNPAAFVDYCCCRPPSHHAVTFLHQAAQGSRKSQACLAEFLFLKDKAP